MPRQTKSPSLARDLLMLGDIYLTLGWMAVQRLRQGPLRPWNARPNRPAQILTLHPSRKEDSEERETVATKPPARAT